MRYFIIVTSFLFPLISIGQNGTITEETRGLIFLEELMDMTDAAIDKKQEAQILLCYNVFKAFEANNQVDPDYAKYFYDIQNVFASTIGEKPRLLNFNFPPYEHNCCYVDYKHDSPVRMMRLGDKIMPETTVEELLVYLDLIEGKVNPAELTKIQPYRLKNLRDNLNKLKPGKLNYSRLRSIPNRTMTISEFNALKK